MWCVRTFVIAIVSDIRRLSYERICFLSKLSCVIVRDDYLSDMGMRPISKATYVTNGKNNVSESYRFRIGNKSVLLHISFYLQNKAVKNSVQNAVEK